MLATRTFIILILSIMSTHAWAQNLSPDRISIPLASKHYGMDGYFKNGELRSFTEFNPGLLFTWEDRALGLDVTVGGYRNSHSNASAVAYLSRTWEVANTGLHVGPFLGTAYYGNDTRFIDSRVTSNGFVLVGGLYARWGNVFLNVVPNPIDDNLRPIVGIGITFPMH